MQEPTVTTASAEATGNRFYAWLQDPLGSIIVASAATMGSLGIVLSGIWVVNTTLG